MEGERKKTTVYIGGQPYTLSSSQTEERVHSVALYVDQQITKLRSSLRYNERMVSVLAALNIADALFDEREKNEALRRELEALQRPKVVYLPADAPEPPAIPQESRGAEKKPGTYARRLTEKQKGTNPQNG